MKYRICHKSGEDKTVISSGFDYFISMSGIVYENYGKSFNEPLWEQVFDAEIIVQWSTGVKTLSEIELFEGDIIRFPSGSEWKIERLGSKFVRINDSYRVIEYIEEGLNVEIVGNVFLKDN
jgi:hypothetical protein